MDDHLEKEIAEQLRIKEALQRLKEKPILKLHIEGPHNFTEDDLRQIGEIIRLLSFSF